MSSAIEGIGKVYLDRSSSQLPVELLPHILEQLSWRVGDLASCCLVSRTWSHYATPLLYSRLFLRNQQRLIQVFRSLHSNSSLAKLVRVLEIRVFPFGLQAEELERLENNILQSLQGAVNLEELHWTRTGSLSVLKGPPIWCSDLFSLEPIESFHSYQASQNYKLLRLLGLPAFTPRTMLPSIFFLQRNPHCWLISLWCFQTAMSLQPFRSGPKS